MEKVLSKEEIQFLINESKNEHYKNSKIIHPSFIKTHIMRVSPKEGLILFYGNDDTGFVHIHERHCSSSLKPFWKEEKKIDDPSKFHRSIVPIIHYLEIAEEIFKPENLNIELNKNPERFDLYIGKATVNNFLEDYKLLLYKNTRIIHNLFPTSSKYKLKKKTKEFYRGNISLSNKILDNKKILSLPYKNFKDEIIYEIKIIFDYSQKLKIVMLHKFEHGNEIKNIILEKEMLTFYISDMILLSYQYEDLSKYEKDFQKL